MNSNPGNIFESLSSTELATAKAMQAKMLALGFIASFTRIELGPVVDTYFYKPIPTAPLAKIMSKTEDIALATGVESLIIQRQLDEISISIPRKERVLIKFDDCLWALFQKAKKQNLELPLMLGKSTVGQILTLDLVEQPHILIAGSTGSGKSVFLSELISCLALVRTPLDLKFILVDTKQLDLTLFSSLDHVIEVVDKIEDLYPVLDLLLREVRKRTTEMKGVARNIIEYNKLARKKYPFYVLVIDELADVISQDKELSKTEEKDEKRRRISDSLKQLAQISRAAGIHIIAATQRPSIKVIDGDIKTNFPTRICFKLPTSLDSRVVLDDGGAELLLGKGDFFYRTAIDSQIKRGHGAFVSMEDIARILLEHERIRETLEGQFLLLEEKEITQ